MLFPLFFIIFALESRGDVYFNEKLEMRNDGGNNVGNDFLL